MTPPALTRFDSGWDRAMTGTTLLSVLTCLAGAAAALYVASTVGEPAPKVIAGALGVLSIMVPLVAFAFAPRAFEIGPGVLRVVRLAGPIEFRVEGKARAVGAEELKGSSRTFGVGGMFGWYGEFRSPTIGPYRLFATQQAGYILVPVSGGPVVVSLDEPEQALLILNSSEAAR